MELPPGFRFHPTDEEVITHYLLKKVLDRSFKATAISDADLNKCEPWDLPRKANIGEKEWFFFFRRDRKYPTGMRTNRATESGYWKATGKDREIYYKSKNCLVGMKKTLVFYKGRAPKGGKTDWVMHEYRLEGKFSNYNISRAAKEEFVVCRVFHKNTTPPPSIQLARIVDHLLDDTPTLPPLVDYNNTIQGHNASSSSKLFWDDHKLQYPQYYNPANYLLPLQDIAVPSLYPQASLIGFPYDYEQGLGQMMSSYQPNVFPFKGGRGQEDLRVITPMMEQYFSSKLSHSEETGVSLENVGNETTSLQSKGDDESTNVRPFDYREIEGLGFSPDVSDLDSLWSY